MTELSFLIKLLLLDELPKPIKEMVAERIREVEMLLCKSGDAYTQVKVNLPQTHQVPINFPGVISSRNGGPPSTQPPPPPIIAEQPEVVAQTPQTQAALASRQQAIDAALSGKIDKVNGRPRKF